MKKCLLMCVLMMSVSGLMFPTSAEAKTKAEKDQLIKKLELDDGSNFVKLQKEADAYKSARFGHTADVKAALWKLQTKSKALLKKISAAERFGYTNEDVFDKAKVLEAFSKVPTADLFKMPKNWKEVEVFNYKLKSSRQRPDFAIETPKVSWFKGAVKYKLPGSKLPADTVVMFWKESGKRWLVVTPSGVPFSIVPLSPTQRGVSGINDGNWKNFGYSFVSKEQARKLGELGTIDKKALKKFESADAKMWKCTGKVMKPFGKKQKALLKKAKSTNRKDKLKKLRVKRDKNLASKCGKSKTKVEKELLSLGKSIEKERTLLLEKVLALPKK